MTSFGYYWFERVITWTNKLWNLLDINIASIGHMTCKDVDTLLFHLVEGTNMKVKKPVLGKFVLCMSDASGFKCPLLSSLIAFKRYITFTCVVSTVVAYGFFLHLRWVWYEVKKMGWKIAKLIVIGVIVKGVKVMF